ncbi:hypothetical protein [Methylobacterium sp. Leaf125]|uniref:hypothetical protein n=1 Tax=Methylobacterium sp. Leaf125 TaxID=1736265 RepID=UPI0012E27C4E|nr:hypothetical protein [Methylobacterium sp. Leaf125]
MKRSGSSRALDLAEAEIAQHLGPAISHRRQGALEARIEHDEVEALERGRLQVFAVEQRPGQMGVAEPVARARWPVEEEAGGPQAGEEPQDASAQDASAQESGAQDTGAHATGAPGIVATVGGITHRSTF